MKIRKLFKFEGAHIVRNCYSSRCKYSIHGHSYLVEIFLGAHVLDRAGMVLDFGALKGEVKDLIDSFDHAIALWDVDDPKYIEDMKRHSQRWIMMPCTPSAEMFAVFFYGFTQLILGNINFTNMEDFRLEAVRVHETATGWAEADGTDLLAWTSHGNNVLNAEFSDAIKDDWKNPKMIEELKSGTRWDMPEPEIQVYADR